MSSLRKEKKKDKNGGVLQVAREDLGNIPFAADAFLPPFEMGDDVGKDPHGVEWGEYGKTDKVAEDDEHEEIV